MLKFHKILSFSTVLYLRYQKVSFPRRRQDLKRREINLGQRDPD